MTAPHLTDWLGRNPAVLRRGPLALILCEDRVLVVETLRHHLDLGFRHVLALSPETPDIPDDMATRVTCLTWDARAPGSHAGAVNAVNDAVPAGTWLYYGFNAEFLFYPFCESRSVVELLTFHAEERRNAMLICTVDLYNPDAAQTGAAVNPERAQFDGRGYFSLVRPLPDGSYDDSHIDIFGGPRWRHEEHIPPASRPLNRPALFRSAPGLRLRADHRFNLPDYNTLSCPWHHNLTGAVASFRLAKGLMANPNTREVARNLAGPASIDFQWTSRQLLDLGLMEPGQWF
ncbi:MAG: hypothetical protein Q4G22_05685 [Paracoccus sp. (in: a-proteobacteria)]|uniref:glycosyltransferase family 2 protein n=1 Tax=Paracoccus sp. TaxID=267 RepID=UPI0026E02B5B|nr:glycosyltransferase family 2 protein [Paracoccus sp. (in: a-proteobacteria)]MDO5631315.1 hypothetical protein [Paracoccus sp. (in: a-proteobacteria)]